MGQDAKKFKSMIPPTWTDSPQSKVLQCMTQILYFPHCSTLFYTFSPRVLQVPWHRHEFTLVFLIMSDKKGFKNEMVMESLNKVQDKWADPEYEEEFSLDIDWKSAIMDKFRDKDVRGMRKEAAPIAQYNVIKLMNEANSESVRLDASKYLLEQEGQGPIKKVFHGVQYQTMSKDQLLAMTKSKLAAIKKRMPDFDVSKLVEGIIVAEADEGDDDESIEE